MRLMQTAIYLMLIVSVAGCAIRPQVDRENVTFAYRAYTFEQFRAVNATEVAADIAARRQPSQLHSLTSWRSTMESLMTRVRVNPVVFGFDEFMEGALHAMGARNYRQTWPEFFVAKCRAKHRPGTEFEFEVPDGNGRNPAGVLKLGGVHLRIPAVAGSLLNEDEGTQTCDLPTSLQPTFIEMFGPQDMLQATTTTDAQLSFGLNGTVWPAATSAVTVNYNATTKYGGFDFKAIVLSPSNSGLDAVFIVELGGGAADE